MMGIKRDKMGRHGALGVLAASVAAGLLAATVGAAPAVAGERVQIDRVGKGFRVLMGGEVFTRYIVEGYAKPILYPVVGPHGLEMTRNYPMKEVDWEAHDHPHHKSLWFAHGDVNGISFWHEGEDAGTTHHESTLKVSEGETGVIQTRNKWVSPEGETVCTDTRTIRFGTQGGDRFIDYEVTVHAPEGHDVTFGDTKEGTMGIRTHPNLRLKPDKNRGVDEVSGQAINSAGDSGVPVWGKNAKWVEYWGEIDGKTVGIAIFDHPENPRHPTTWHARQYGLIAANPFGLYHFKGKEKGTGDYTIPAGESETFRYRFLFHKGGPKEAKIEQRYERYAGSSADSK